MGIRIGKFFFCTEKAGTISEKALYICFHDSGHMYCGETIKDFLRELIFEWNNDKHLIGY